MGGTLEGGRAAAITNKSKYGADYYVRMGAKEGRFGAADGTIKGFAANRELARTAGAKGGEISRRKPAPGSRRWLAQNKEAA